MRFSVNRICTPILLASFGILAACDLTPKPDDKIPPKIIVTEAKAGFPVVNTTSITPQTMPAITACTDGTRPYEKKGDTPAQKLDAQNANYILAPGQDRINLLFSFNDLSGIKYADMTVAAGDTVILKPALVPEVTATSGGGTALFYKWV